MARFPYAAAGCEGHTAELGSFRPANNSPSRRHWPLRAPHVSLYSALFLRVLRPGPRRSPLAGGSDRHIIRSGREIARKIFPCSGVPFWAFCRLSPAAASAPFSPLRFTFPGDRRQGFPRRCFNGLSQEGGRRLFCRLPGRSRFPFTPLCYPLFGGRKKRETDRSGPSPLGMYGVCLTWREPPRPPWPRQQPWPFRPGPS